MNTSELITAIDAEISRLQQARELPADSIGTGTREEKRTLSAEGRARIAAAQKKRWAERKKANKR